MSVFNRLEIANFLNLDNVLPSEAGWTTHYPHLVLNFRGQSAAVVATTGIGKTSINRAVYALLTRDHEFISSTKRVCAPKRSGAFTHLRLEVLYRDKSIGHLRGQIGTDVPGEPYVIGVYGNADTELVQPVTKSERCSRWNRLTRHSALYSRQTRRRDWRLRSRAAWEPRASVRNPS
jgi:hypothetical protein